MHLLGVLSCCLLSTHLAYLGSFDHALLIHCTLTPNRSHYNYFLLSFRILNILLYIPTEKADSFQIFDHKYLHALNFSVFHQKIILYNLVIHSQLHITRHCTFQTLRYRQSLLSPSRGIRKLVIFRTNFSIILNPNTP